MAAGEDGRVRSADRAGPAGSELSPRFRRARDVAFHTVRFDEHVLRPFPRPETGRIAVKVINHFGDEVMQVFGV